MKTKRLIEQVIDVATIFIEVPVRYEEEDIPNDFPLRAGDMWRATIDIDTGEVVGWPKGKSGRLSMNVCDEGIYALYDRDGKFLVRRKGDYVPHGVVPGEYGDYIQLEINEHGIVTNWPKQPNFDAFFKVDSQ